MSATNPEPVLRQVVEAAGLRSHERGAGRAARLADGRGAHRFRLEVVRGPAAAPVAQAVDVERWRSTVEITVEDVDSGDSAKLRGRLAESYAAALDALTHWPAHLDNGGEGSGLVAVWPDPDAAPEHTTDGNGRRRIVGRFLVDHE